VRDIKDKRNYILLSLIPSALCLSLSLTYNNSNADSALGVLFAGMVITCLVSPLLLTILCRYYAIKKNLSLSTCVIISLSMNTLANITHIISLCIISLMMSSSIISMILYTLPSFAFSMAITGVCLFIVKLIKRKYEKL